MDVEHGSASEKSEADLYSSSVSIISKLKLSSNVKCFLGLVCLCTEGGVNDEPKKKLINYWTFHVKSVHLHTAGVLFKGLWKDLGGRGGAVSPSKSMTKVLSSVLFSSSGDGELAFQI